MRHRKSFNHLGRKPAHRKAMLSNMASSLIMNKRITTTTAKAKALRSYVEPLLTKAKEDTTHSRRVVFGYLQDKDAVTELFREVSTKIAERPGGYTRILKIGNRLGDNADMAIIELVDYNENLLTEKSDAKTTTGKRRRRGGSKKETAPVAETKAVVEEASIVEEVKEADAEEAVNETVEETAANKAGEIKDEVATEEISKEVIAESTETESETDEIEDEKQKGEEEKES